MQIKNTNDLRILYVQKRIDLAMQLLLNVIRTRKRIPYKKLVEKYTQTGQSFLKQEKSWKVIKKNLSH